MKPQAFFHAFNGQEAQIRFIPILRQHVGDANPRSLKDVGQEYGDFFPWLPVHIFFLLSMYLLLIMFTLAVALYILYCFILCFSYICTFHIIWSVTFLSFSFTFSHFIQIHPSLLSGCFPVKAGANANLAKTKGSSAPSLA